MKHTLNLLAAATLIALTGCGNGETEAAPATSSSAPIETVNTATDVLQPNPDGYDMRVMYQWIPELPSIKPAEAQLNIQIKDETQEVQESYVTPSTPGDLVPSIDSGQYLTKDFSVPPGGTFTAESLVSDPPNDGRLTCLIVEVKQQVALDYQETSVGASETLSCMGYTHDDHDYKAGQPPVEVKFN